MLQSEIRKQRDGTREIEVCGRVVDAVVENVTGDPSKGHKTIQAYCSRPLVLNIAENAKMCPQCDKQPPIGNVHPRITNAAGVILTKKELEECGVTGKDPSQIPTKVPKKTKEAKKAVEAKVSKVLKDSITISITLDLLEQSEDVARTLIVGASQALDKLPVTNFAESKRLIRLQEKLDALAKV
jgi:hypothetical protein